MPSEILLECAARGGIQRHLAGFEAFAVADAHGAGTVAQGDVGRPQCRHFADAQPGLQHHLGQRVVARSEAMGRSAGGAQQCMDLGIGQTGRLAIAHHAHRPEIAGDIAAQCAGAARPSA
jgi:hypothetical protein